MHVATTKVPAVRAWLAATRPATLTACIAPVAVGSALAAADGAFAWVPALVALFGALFIQIGTNFYNDHADFVRGADTAERLGPARAVQRGWLSSRQMVRGALFAFALATAVGVYLIGVAGWPIAVLGVLSIAAGILYTGGPVPLAYSGLGDVFVLAFFGLGAVTGSYWVQTRAIGGHVLASSLAVGALTAAILVVNNLRDRHTDARAGKRTLVVRFGRRFGLVEHAALVVVAYAITVTMAVVRRQPGWLLPLLSAPFAASVIGSVRSREGAALNRELGRTALLGLVFSALLSVGVLL